MLTYCVKCRENTEKADSKVSKTKNGRKMLLSRCAVCANSVVYKMNEIVDKSLLGRDKFMSEMHLKQPGFTCRACGPFTKNK